METTCVRGALMAHRICDVPECGRPHSARGYCSMHWQRWKKHGDPTYIAAERGCSVDGCDRRHFGRGYCNTHWARLYRTGMLDVTPRVRKTCTFDDCGRPAVSQGHCTGHAQQAQKGKPLTPLRPMHRSTIRDEQGRKRCAVCKDWKDAAEFYPNRRNADGLGTYCKRCDRSARLKRNYGITVDQYEALLAAQGAVCAICGGPPKDGPSLHIDHDHACCATYKRSCGKCVRGLLCEDCNRVLGMFSDDTARFEAAIDYLKNGVARHE